NRLIKQVFAGQVVDVAFEGRPDQGRIEEADVVAGQNDRPRQRDSLGIVNAPAEIEPIQCPEPDPASKIHRVHPCSSTGASSKPASARRFLTSAMIRPLVWSEVRCELLMTFAPRATMSGAAARWLSRSSRTARSSCTPSAARRRERSSSCASRKYLKSVSGK